MPRASEDYYAKEKAYAEAVYAIHEGRYKDVSDAARKTFLNRRVLADRYNGKSSKSTRQAGGKRLSKDQEEALVQYILRCDERNMSLTPQLIEAAANFLLDDVKPVGENWVKRFLKRNPSLKKRRHRSILANRQAAYHIQELEIYFRRLEEVIEKYGIIECDIWNIDETGFRIGCDKSRVVVTLDTKRPAKIADSDNREYVTAMEAANAEGDTIPPMLIFKGADLVMHKWSATNDLHRSITLASSESAYINDDLAIDYIKHFIDAVKRKRIGIYILLIMDGCDSHKTYEFGDLCTKNNIIPFLLPSHSTHILQPLDVGVFQAYKQHHGNELYRAVLRDNVKFDKLAFLVVFQTFRNLAFKASTIKHAFKRIGILPFNLAIVLDPAKKKHALEIAVARPAREDTPNLDDCLYRISRGPGSHHRNIREMREHYLKYGEFFLDPDQMINCLDGWQAQTHAY